MTRNICTAKDDLTPTSKLYDCEWAVEEKPYEYICKNEIYCPFQAELTPNGSLKYMRCVLCHVNNIKDIKRHVISLEHRRRKALLRGLG